MRRTEDECLFNGLMESHHYLGYTQPVGEHLKHMVFADNRPVACLGWSSAPWHIGPRDRFIGWTPAVRRKNLHLIAYNTRFLILPWVKVKHLASHILGLAMRNISNDWQKAYGHPIHYLESFVDTERFARHLLQGGQLDMPGADNRQRDKGQEAHRKSVAEGCAWLPAVEGLSGASFAERQGDGTP